MERRHLGYLCWAAAGILLLALLDMPYGYYQFLRIVVCITGVAAGYALISKGRISAGAIAAVGAIIFNPLLPLHFEREHWSYLNIAFALGFFLVGLAIAAQEKETRPASPPRSSP